MLHLLGRGSELLPTQYFESTFIYLIIDFTVVGRYGYGVPKSTFRGNPQLSEKRWIISRDSLGGTWQHSEVKRRFLPVL